MSNLNENPDQWLKEQFEYEYCRECGGDVQHHTAVPFMDNWFARCDYPPLPGGEFHPVVDEFRREESLR